MGLGDILLFIFDFEHCANDLISGAWSSFFLPENVMKDCQLTLAKHITHTGKYRLFLFPSTIT
jgi:hypothetical protein